MKKMIALGFAVLSHALIACAAEDDATGSDQSNLSPALTTDASIAGCNGNKDCVNALVLRALFSSDLRFESETNEAQTPLAREIVSDWLTKENDGRISSITVEAKGNDAWSIRIVLAQGHETKEDEGDAAALMFGFTIEGTRIVETLVRASFAG